MLAELRFGPLADDPAMREEQVESVDDYMSLLIKNGQVLGESLVANCESEYRLFVELSRRNALTLEAHSSWGKEARETVVALLGAEPELILLDAEAGAEEAHWEGSSSLVLFTHFLDTNSPLVRGNDVKPVAVFTLPLPDSEREYLGAWAWAYRAHDAVWFHSGDLETVAYKQLAEPTSGLAEEGRALAKQVEDATGIPTYYYLLRYWGRRSGENTRPCPGCGRPWEQNEEVESGRELFTLRCESCRLVSDAGSTTDDQRRARIGEYRK